MWQFINVLRNDRWWNQKDCRSSTSEALFTGSSSNVTSEAYDASTGGYSGQNGECITSWRSLSRRYEACYCPTTVQEIHAWSWRYQLISTDLKPEFRIKDSGASDREQIWWARWIPAPVSGSAVGVEIHLFHWDIRRCCTWFNCTCDWLRRRVCTCAARFKFSFWHCRPWHTTACTESAIWIWCSNYYLVWLVPLKLTQAFRYNTQRSRPYTVDCSVPQESVLGPKEFIAYTEELAELIDS